MQKLNQLTNNVLLDRTERLIRRERKCTALLLECINEVERRRLYLELGFSSLYDWLTKKYGYSEASAYRRIQAAKLINTEVKQHLEAGAINLSALTVVQQAIKIEKQSGNLINSQQTQQLIQSVCGKSKTEVIKTLASQLPEYAKVEAKPKEFIKENTDSSLRVSLTINADLRKKLERARQVLSHKHPSPTWEEFLEMLVDFTLSKKDPLKQKVDLSAGGTLAKEHSSEPCPRKEGLMAQHLIAAKIEKFGEPCPNGNRSSSRLAPRSPIPAKLRAFIFQRDQCCQYQNPQGNICGSQHLLEIDHVTPVSLGGVNDPENMRVLCDNHNRYRNA